MGFFPPWKNEVSSNTSKLIVMRPVCILQPPASLTNRAPCLDDRQYGLGILALVAWLEQDGFPTVALHLPLARLEGASITSLIDEIKTLDPLVVAIGLNWVHFSGGAIEVARLLRNALPTVPIVVGGQHASLFADEIMAKYADCLDAVIVGEAERPMSSLCRAVAEHGRIPSGIPGVRTTESSGATVPDVVSDIDSLPLYSYRSMRPKPLQPKSGAITTARGACPFRCAYCIEPVVGRVQGRARLTFHSPDWIVAQMQRLMAEGVDRFTIQDNFFVGGDRMLVALAERMRKQAVRPVHLNLFAHPESYGQDGFAALADCTDLATVDFGVETGAPDVAQRAHRSLIPERVVTAVRHAAEAGVVPYSWWLVGLPGETEATREQTRALLLDTMRVGGIPRWVSTLVLLPGTAMHARPSDYGISTRFHSFDDYTAFSEKTLAEALHFPDLITHSLEGSSPEDILTESRTLRRFILENFNVLERFYQTNEARKADLVGVRQSIANAFF